MDIKNVYNGILRTIIISAFIFMLTVASSFIYCHFSYNNYLQPEIKKEIQKELNNKYKLGSDMSYQSIIDRTETYYDRKFQHLLYVFGTIVALFGLGLPILVTFFQHMSLKEDKENISKANNGVKDAIKLVTSARQELTDIIDEERQQIFGILITLANSSKYDFTQFELLATALETGLNLKNPEPEAIKNVIYGLNMAIKDHDHRNHYNKNNMAEYLNSLKKTKQKCANQFPSYSTNLSTAIEELQKFYDAHKKWTDEINTKEQNKILANNSPETAA